MRTSPLLLVGLVGMLGGCSSPVQRSDGEPLSSHTGTFSATESPSYSPADPALRLDINRQTGLSYEAYRDYAAFTYVNVHGETILSQWLINHDGLGYWDRTCSMLPGGDVNWASCTSWGAGWDVADLGLPGFGPISGMSTYVFSDAHASQWLIQSVLDASGAHLKGRLCPIGPFAPDFSQCSGWDKLEEKMSDVGVRNIALFRDRFEYTFTNGAGAPMISQTLLGMDGSITWQRACPLIDGGPTPYVDPRCRFGAPEPIRSVGIPLTSIVGRGGYTYTDGGRSFYVETIVASTMADAGRRVCPVTTDGIDWRGCSSFANISLANLRTGGGPL